MRIQVNLPDGLNKKLKIDKVNYGCVTLQETLIENLERYYRLISSPLYDKKGNPLVLE